MKKKKKKMKKKTKKKEVTRKEKKICLRISFCKLSSLSKHQQKIRIV